MPAMVMAQRQRYPALQGCLQARKAGFGKCSRLKALLQVPLRKIMTFHTALRCDVKDRPVLSWVAWR